MQKVFTTFALSGYKIFTFDLNGVDEIVFDVFVPTGGLLFPEGIVGVWDGTFGWNESENVP